LFDGGDRGAPVEVMQDWTVLGLDQEDTVAHYDTLDGRTEVQPSNRVPIYAPRFGAVRKVDGLTVHEQHNRLAGVELPTGPELYQEQSFATTVIQPVQPERYLGMKTPSRFREQVPGLGIAGSQVLADLTNRFRLYEDFQIIRQGRFDNSEKARLAACIDAAVTWSSDQAAQVTIDGKAATVASNALPLQDVHQYEMPPGKPRLRIVKVASKKQAQPGEEVEFTLRFDNVGDQIVGMSRSWTA
jgi:hypothetical protein